MRRSLLAVGLVALLVAPLLAGGTAGATPTHDETLIEIDIRPSGDAVWTVSAEYNLSSPNDTAAFERLRSEYEAGASDTGVSADVFREAAGRVSERTGREMAIEEVTRSSDIRVGNNTTVGILRLQFTWTNFATVDGDQISVGSAFAGGWFGDLAAHQTLRIEPPPGYRVETASPPTDITGGALQWEGPLSFGPGEPAIEFSQPATSEPGPTTPDPDNGIPWTYAALAFTGLVVGGLVLLAWQGGYLGSEGADTNGDGPSSGDGSETAEAGAAGAAGAATGAAAGSEGDGSGDAAAEEDEVDEELLSDEERVERLLRQHGGRMKQAQIVEETRWSNAKVSQLLSSMAEEGRIEKLRIGRENLISFPDESED